MATLKQRLRRKNASGTYDTVHLETESGMILRPSGRTVEADLAAYLPEYQDSDDVPKSLVAGKIISGLTKAWLKLGDQTITLANTATPVPNVDMDNCTITVSDNTITEVGDDYRLVTTIETAGKIIQTLTVGDTTYTKTITLTDDTITEVTEVA